MSRIDLDAVDLGSVERARGIVAESEALDTGTATSTDLLCAIGRLQAAAGILLRIIDGGAA